MADNRNANELLNDIKEALDLLADRAALFGRGPQLDIIEAKKRIDLAAAAVDADNYAYSAWERSHGFNK